LSLKCTGSCILPEENCGGNKPNSGYIYINFIPFDPPAHGSFPVYLVSDVKISVHAESEDGAESSQQQQQQFKRIEVPGCPTLLVSLEVQGGVREVLFQANLSCEVGISISLFTAYMNNGSNWSDGTLAFNWSNDMMTAWSAGDTHGIEEGRGRMCYSATDEDGRIRYFTATSIPGGGLLVASSRTPSPNIDKLLKSIAFSAIVSSEGKRFMEEEVVKKLVLNTSVTATTSDLPRVTISSLPHLSTTTDHDFNLLERLSPEMLFVVVKKCLIGGRVVVKSEDREHAARWLHDLATLLQPFQITPFSSNPTEGETAILQNYPSGFLASLPPGIDPAEPVDLVVQLDSGTLEIATTDVTPNQDAPKILEVAFLSAFTSPTSPCPTKYPDLPPCISPLLLQHFTPPNESAGEATEGFYRFVSLLLNDAKDFFLVPSVDDVLENKVKAFDSPKFVAMWGFNGWVEKFVGSSAFLEWAESYTMDIER
jgi:hypothetical protein